MASSFGVYMPRQELPQVEGPISHGRVSPTALIACLWAGVAISAIFLIARIWIRIRVFGRLQLDDPFVIVAWTFCLINAAIWTAVRDDLYFNLALGSGQIPMSEIPSNFLQRVERLIRGNLAAYLIAYASLWSIKISFLVFFRRFGEKLRNQRIAWYAVLGFCIASFAVCVGTVDYHCLTKSGMNMLTICTSPRTTKFEYVTLRLTTSLDVLTDASIILLSTNVLWRVSLNIWTKLALGGLFSLTLFVITIAIIRLAYASVDGRLDLSWLVLWAGIELSVALIIVSLASFRILYTSTQKANQPPTPHYGDSSDTKEFRKKGNPREWTELSNISQSSQTSLARAV